MIEGLENLKSKLGDDASIYNKEDRRTTKQKWKDMNSAEKWQYFKDYLLSRLIGGLIGLGLLIWFCVSVFGPKAKDVLYIGTIDSPLEDETFDLMADGIEEVLGIEDPEKEQVFFDTGYYFTSDEYNSRMKLVTVIAAGQMDCIIMPVSEAQTEVNGGVAEDLFAAGISSETLNAIQDKIIYMTPVDEDDEGNSVSGDEGAYCIDITECLERIAGYSFKKSYCLMIVANAPNMDNAEALIKYLFELE